MWKAFAISNTVFCCYYLGVKAFCTDLLQNRLLIYVSLVSASDEETVRFYNNEEDQ